ncbi:PRC-barrel domain-containing protein [Bacillus alkalicellulosilyticus]|uniref:PRC-barrel domain-containing protein n=1 Tax=Alkalihalobacterium alkalicellulosilyticum TaxID=1912214 RepID=UPI0009974840|nr:PRC-barrel domain-containing protein [Bacillus alkalicellulosilyticus]
MRTFSSICGRPIYEIETGEELGIVEDLFINKHGQVTGLQLDIKAWLQRDRFVPLSAITEIGADGVFISNRKQLRSLDKHHMSGFTLKQGKKRLAGMPLLTAEGEKLGLVEDVYFMEELGTIIGYEVTEGLLADLKEGKRVVKITEPLLYGKDILMMKK